MVYNPREKRDLGGREDEHCQTKGEKINQSWVR